jgi:hypothetical protein
VYVAGLPRVRLIGLWSISITLSTWSNPDRIVGTGSLASAQSAPPGRVQDLGHEARLARPVTPVTATNRPKEGDVHAAQVVLARTADREPLPAGATLPAPAPPDRRK